MNSNQLKYVKAVAETGSFTLAAERCCVTQPTLSNGIAQLEQELEERLFTRTTRSVSLTSFGQHILPFIDRVLDAQVDLLHETKKFVHPSRMVIRIGTSPLISGSWLAPMLEAFRKEYPDIEIILREHNMADLYRMLSDELLDFVFGVAESHKTSWGKTFLYREPLYYIPRGAECPQGDGAVTFESIAGELFIMVPNACGLAQATRALFRNHRSRLNRVSGRSAELSGAGRMGGLGSRSGHRAKVKAAIETREELPFEQQKRKRADS